MKLRTALAGIVGVTTGALILAGCSAGGAAPTTETSDATTVTQPSGAPDGQGRDRMGFGVSGEIVFAQDGTVQVQDANSQTAVRYTSATTVDQEVTVALSDVSVGQCVFALVGDDGTATTVRVTDPVDGECNAGFGQGGFEGRGAQGGDRAMPSGAPTALPDGGAMPSGGPTDFPRGGQGGFDGTFVTGSVSAVSGTGLTVKTQDGSSDVTVGSATTITGTEVADQSAIVVGMCLTAQGKSDDAGGFDATSITLSAKGDDGCSARGFGGGMRDGQGRQGGGSNG